MAQEPKDFIYKTIHRTVLNNIQQNCHTYNGRQYLPLKKLKIYFFFFLICGEPLVCISSAVYVYCCFAVYSSLMMGDIDLSRRFEAGLK